ncbi:MAG: PQQ-binding-like beta-propeller repeat protein [Polyangiaceae bacterium]|nr:PQQ-binding-like beta-propeller repeat protein [Polyangiaceae bacterium]
MNSAWRWGAGCALGLWSLAFAGCSAMRVGANPELPGWTHRPSWSMSVVYSRTVVAPTRHYGEPYERGQPEIDPDGRRVFVGSSDGGLYALRAEDGSLIWRFETLGFVQSEPLYDAATDSLFFGSNDGALYKVDASTGALKYRFMTNAEVSRRPVLANGLLYAVNANDTVLALDPNDGKLVWSQHRAPALGMEIAGHSSALVSRGKVYVAFSDGTVTAFDARTGHERWQPFDLSAEAEQTLGEIPKYLDVDTTPIAHDIEAGPCVFVGSYEGGIFALEADTGTQIWTNPAVTGVTDLLLWRQPAHRRRTGRGSTLPARTLLLASTGTTGLWAVDPETGREIWRRTLPSGGVSRPVPILGALLIASTDRGVFLVHPLDGRIIDGFGTGDGVSMTPAAHGRRAFVVTDGGRLLSLLVSPPIGDSGRPRTGFSPGF